MSVIIQLQNLPLSASSVDIRNYFGGLSIPPGGVHIVGGKKGSAFIAFSNDEDARQAMGKNGRRIKDARIKLALSSHTELKEVLENLHKEQSEYEMSRKVRLTDSKQERSRSHLKHRRSRSRSLERNYGNQEFSPGNHKSRTKYEDHSQKANQSVKQRSLYDQHAGRRIQYSDGYNQEFVSAPEIDKPNPYMASTCESHSEEDERNEEIRKHIESFIATFGQAENYNMLEVNKDAYPKQTIKASHTYGSDGLPQSTNMKEAMQQNRSQGFPSGQMPMNNYQPKIFDFDSRRHFDDRLKGSMSETLQGHSVSSINSPYNSSREQEQRTVHSSDGNAIPNPEAPNIFSQDLLLNSPMDIEEDKNGSEKFHVDQHFGSHVFKIPEEISKVHGGNLPIPTTFNVPPPPFKRFENPGVDLRLGTFGKEQTDAISCDPAAAKDLCIKLEGLPYYASESDIRRVFQDTSIFDMFIQYTSDGKATGFGFVQFSSAEDLRTVIKMKYCMIGEYRVEFRGSSRAELMEARMPSSNTVTNIETNSAYEEVLALKRTQDILSSMIIAPPPLEGSVPTSYPPILPSYPAMLGPNPSVPASNQQQMGKRSLCAVITGFPSHFTRHIQVLKCIEDIGINFHLVHLVLNNRSRFIGKVFAEFHDLRDLDAALKKHNQSVEGCTIGVKQVLYEEMGKFLDSHRSRCMYPTPKQPDHLQKPEKSLYIWEPPYEAVDKYADGNRHKNRSDAPAVWSCERAMTDQRQVASNGFFPQMNQREFLGNSNEIQAFNADFGIHKPHDSRGASRDIKTDRFQFPNAGAVDVGGSYSNINKEFQVTADSFHGNPKNEMSSFAGESRGFPSSRSKEGRTVTSRKNEPLVHSRGRHRGRSPIRHRLKREDSPEDTEHKRFRNERGRRDAEVRFLDLEPPRTRQIHSQERRRDVSPQKFKDERRDEHKYSSGQAKSKIGSDSPPRRDIAKMKDERLASHATFKKNSGGGTSPHKSFGKSRHSMEHSPKAKPEREKLPPRTSDNVVSPKSLKKKIEHRKNCPKRQRALQEELEQPRHDDHPKHRSGRSDSRGDIRDFSKPKDPFSKPGCILEATNVDPHVGLYELLDFFRGYDLESENLIRRYTDTGEPTGDLRIAFCCPEDAEQAYKILNQQHLKGNPVVLSFV